MVSDRWQEYEPAVIRRRSILRPAILLGGLLTFAIVVVTVFAFGGVTSAQAPARAASPPTAKAGETFGDWVYECQAAKDNQQNCALSQTLISGDTKKPVAKFNLGREPQSGIVYLAVLLPLGIDLPAGVVGAVDDKEQFNYRLETCLQLGCIARIEADAALLTAMKSGKTLKLGFRFRGAAQATVLPGSLSGMTAGAAAAALE